MKFLEFYCSIFLNSVLSQAHHLTVKQLSFRPHTGEIGEKETSQTLLLASAGADHSVKIHALTFNDI